MSFGRSSARRLGIIGSHLVACRKQFTNSRIPAQSFCSDNSGETSYTDDKNIHKMASASSCYSTETDSLTRNNVMPEPKDCWSKDTLHLYNELSKLAEDSNGLWVKLSNFYYSGKYHTFSGSIDENGKKLYEYFVFLNKSENRSKFVCQFGPSTMGPKGFVHGGAIAGILDVVAAGLTNRCGYDSLTANISVDFKQSIPMETTVLCDAHIESIQGRKVYSYVEMRSHDGLQLYSTAKCLCITVNGK